MIKTDIIIIGAGPVGLFTVFEAGLLKMKCHLIDVLPKAGGQCIELYPKKPIYDIPAHPEILAGDLIEKLINQSSQFKPGFTLGEKAPDAVEVIVDPLPVHQQKRQLGEVVRVLSDVGRGCLGVCRKKGLELQEKRMDAHG